MSRHIRASAITITMTAAIETTRKEVVDDRSLASMRIIAPSGINAAKSNPKICSQSTRNTSPVAAVTCFMDGTVATMPINNGPTITLAATPLPTESRPSKAYQPAATWPAPKAR